MDITGIETYAAYMNEIKERISVIDLFLTGQRDADFVQTTAETMGLQFRKVLELIAFASLAANRDQYSFAYSDFATHWAAAKLLKNLKRINPTYYPKPVVPAPTTHPKASRSLKERDPDYLTEDDLIEAHGRCGKLMHARNPFASPIDYAFFQEALPIWRMKVINLLNHHEVHLAGDRGFYLVHMHDDRYDGDVRWYRLDPVDQ